MKINLMLTPLLVLAPTLAPPALAQDADGRPESEIVVTGRDYNALETTSATKTRTPVLETPQSIQVITEGLIDDRRPVTLTEALYNASGVSDGGGRRATFDFPLIRGFDASADIFLDGLRVERGSTNFSYELLGLERIEVLKGPSSLLFGQSALGGVINEVSRRPTFGRHLTVEGTYGSQDFVQARLDVGAPLGDNVAVRLNGLYRESDDYIDFLDRRRIFVAPSLTWRISPRTEIAFLAAYTDDETDGSYIGLPAEGTVLPNINGPIDRRRNVREPGYDGLSIERRQIGYLFRHAFSDTVILRQNLRYSSADVLSRLTVALALLPDQRTLLRGVGRFENEDHSLAVDTNLEFNLVTGSVRHKFLAGLDVLRQDVRQSFAFGLQGSLDLYAPVYGQPVGPLFPPGNDFDRDDLLVGLYLQDQISFGERLHLVIGGRLDSANTDNRDFVSGTSSDQNDTVFVPRAGIVYEVAPSVSLYGSWARSFNPNFGVSADGELFAPERGEAFEAGIKVAFPDNRINATVAVYQIRRTNVLTGDPDPLNAGFSIATGAQRSRGVDIDAAFRLAEGWNLIATYAYTDIRITEDSAFEGDRPINVPRHQASFFSKYDISHGPLRGLGFGLGGRLIGRREATLPNSYRLPSYFTADAVMSYRTGPWRAQLNVTNLFDKDYFPSSASTGGIGVLVGEPRTVRLTLGYAL